MTIAGTVVTLRPIALPGVRVAWVNLDGADPHLPALWEVLNGDERAWAHRLVFSRDRARYVAARGALRMVLGHLLDIAPAGVRLVVGPHGKPRLADDHHARSQDRAVMLGFNLTHSSGYALMAITDGRDVGVDLERIRSDVDLDVLVRHCFSAAERARWTDLSATLRPAAFYACWTRKEAYVKARGKGLTLPLESFDVTLSPDEPAVLLATRPDPEDTARWQMRALDAPAGFAAAVVVAQEAQPSLRAPVTSFASPRP